MNDLIKEQQLEFLNETINHYNSNNRCVVPKGGMFGNDLCKYAPVSGNTHGCAIGRKLPIEIAELIDKRFPQGAAVSNSNVWQFIPYELGKLGRGFLAAVQRLHDEPRNFDENGLTDAGRVFVRGIKEEFNLERLTEEV